MDEAPDVDLSDDVVFRETLIELLGAVGIELQRHRLELARLRDALTIRPADAGDEFTCQHCHAFIVGEVLAKDHAVKEHGAPRADWRDVYQEPEP